MARPPTSALPTRACSKASRSQRPAPSAGQCRETALAAEAGLTSLPPRWGGRLSAPGAPMFLPPPPTRCAHAAAKPGVAGLFPMTDGGGEGTPVSAAVGGMAPQRLRPRRRWAAMPPLPGCQATFRPPLVGANVLTMDAAPLPPPPPPKGPEGRHRLRSTAPVPCGLLTPDPPEGLCGSLPLLSVRVASPPCRLLGAGRLS